MNYLAILKTGGAITFFVWLIYLILSKKENRKPLITIIGLVIILILGVLYFIQTLRVSNSPIRYQGRIVDMNYKPVKGADCYIIIKNEDGKIDTIRSEPVGSDGLFTIILPAHKIDSSNNVLNTTFFYGSKEFGYDSRFRSITTSSIEDFRLDQPQSKSIPKEATLRGRNKKENWSLSKKKLNIEDSSKKIKIAILPFECISNENKYLWLSKGLPEMLITTLSSVTKYIVIEGNMRDKVLEEIDFQQGKYIDKKSAVKIGKLLGSQQIILGSYQINNDKLEIISRIVNVENGSVETGSIVKHTGNISDPFMAERDYSLKVADLLKKAQ